MTPQEMIDVIQAYRDGKLVETNDGGSDWWPVLSPQFNFNRFTYRIKPPVLRPHWPAVVRTPCMEYIVTAEVFPEDHPPLQGYIRLATEYPPVMLP